MSGAHTEEQPPSAQAAEVLPIPVTLCDDQRRVQPSPPPLTATSVPVSCLPQQLMHDKHPILLDLAHQNEIPMPTLTNQTLLADCELRPASTKSGIVQSPLCSSKTSISHTFIINNSICGTPMLPVTETSSKTLNIVSSSSRPRPIPSFIKIRSAKIVPKHHAIQLSPSSATSVPIEIPTVAKHKFSHFGTALKSDAAQISDRPHLLIPNSQLKKKPVFLTSTLLSGSAGSSSVPELIPVKSVGLPKQTPFDVECTTAPQNTKNMASVLIQPPHLETQAPSNKFINVKISNGKIQSSNKASFKFVGDKPMISSNLLKLSRPQSNFKLHSFYSRNRLVSKYATPIPVSATSKVSNCSANKSVSEDEAQVKNVCSNDTDMNQDLNRCLQEAVESMFSPSSPESSKASHRSSAKEEGDDVTLIKMPALSATLTVQEEHSFKHYPDDVKIELVKHEASDITFMSTETPIKSHLRSLESHRAQPDSTTSCPTLAPDKQGINVFFQLPISAGDTTLIPADDKHPEIKTETPETDDESLNEEATSMPVIDVAPIIETTTLVTVDVKPADNNSGLGENYDLKTKLLPMMSMKFQSIDQPNESATPQDIKETAALADKASGSSISCDTVTKPSSGTLVGCYTDTVGKPVPESPSKYSMNEYGLIEFDTDSKESVKSKNSENTDGSKPNQLKINEDQIRTKSKIGILCKRGRNSDKKLKIKKEDTIPDEPLGLENEEIFAKKKKTKKKIKSPISKPAEIKDGTANDSVKSTDDIYHCDACGCYGLEVEFLNSRFCSSLCEEDWDLKVEEDMKKEKDRAQVQLKRRKKKLLEKVQHEIELQKLQEEAEKELQLSLEIAPKSDPEPSVPIISEQSPQSNISKEETSNDGSQESTKPRLPWQTGKHGFSWTKYLEYNKAKPAPVKLFKDPFPYSKNNFKVGMKLEGIDPKHPNHFCVLSVAEVCGFRLKLHFDGYSSLYDFWINADSMDIFPAGWCEKNGYTLHSPPTYDQEVFSWSEYLKYCRAPPAPKSLFYNKTGDTICPNGFRIGMKLEAVDRQNTSLVCVATVVGLMDSRIMVHFDGWDDIYNYWADPSSSYIHPVGWCEEHDHKLTPPSDWDISDFTWEKYLQETKSPAAPARAFKQRVLGGFKRGMKLECVDKRMPMAVRVATVDDIREHQIRVKFDGWSDIYSYWVDEDSRDIHPMGWCQTVGHVLELPLTSEDYTLDCPTPECHGQGHVMGSKHLTNHTVPGCPFDPQILIKKEEIPDRLTSTPESPTGQVFTKEKRPGETKNPVGRPAKWRRLEGGERVSADSQNELQEITDFTRERKRKKRKIGSTAKKVDMNLVCQELRQSVLNPGYKPCGPEEPEQWLKHSYPLNVYISSVTSECDFTNWSEDHVIELVTSISGSNAITNIFREHGIDGEAFSMMTQDDLVSSMGIKIGPALKIFNCIMLLRQKAKQSKTSNIF